MNADEARPLKQVVSGEVRLERKEEEKGRKKKNVVFSYSNMGLTLGSCRAHAGRRSPPTNTQCTGCESKRGDRACI